MASSRLRQLLVLPAALFVGHAITEIVGHGASSWSGDLVQALACVSLPAALAAVLLSLNDGASGRSDRIRPGALVAQQILAFLAVDAVEHLAAGSPPAAVLTSRAFWVAIAAHTAAAGLLWFCLRASLRAGASLAERAKALVTSRRPQLDEPHDVREPAPRLLALSSLSRRGPPTALAIWSA